MRISGLGYYPNPLDPDEGRVGVLSRAHSQGHQGGGRLHVPVVNTFIGRDRARSPRGELPLFPFRLAELIRFAEEAEVKIAIENCPMLFTQDEWPGGDNLAYSPAIWRRMFEEIPSKSFGLNYDPSHLVWQQMDYVKPVYEFKDRIFHVHLKDAKVRRDRLDDVGILATPLEYHTPKLRGLATWRGAASSLP